MTFKSLGCVLLGIGLLFTAGCSVKTDPIGTADGGTDANSEASTSDAGKGTSISCYTSVQFFCEENPTPTAADEENLRVLCSSGSGVFEKPAKCPPAGFLGKCTYTTDGTLRVRRYYPGEGVDIAYNEDYCVKTALGVWSTTF